MADKKPNTLAVIQSKLKVPKGRYNKSGGFHFRNTEDILEAVKPLAAELGFSISLTDAIEMLGDRFYIASTAVLSNGVDEFYESTAFAREDAISTALSGPQLTGASSSYARKAALCGLFAIDDGEDADATEKPPVDVEVLRGTLRALIISMGSKVAAEKLSASLLEFGIKNLSAVSTVEDPKVIQSLIDVLKPAG
jgi:hypothetical protein